MANIFQSEKLSYHIWPASEMRNGALEELLVKLVCIDNSEGEKHHCHLAVIPVQV